MSQQDLWAAIGRAKIDEAFATGLFRDFEAAIGANGYSLTPEEMQTAKAAMSDGPLSQQAGLPLQDLSDGFKFQQEQMRKRFAAQVERMIDISQFTASILKETIGHAAHTYRRITLMNQVMFWMGVSLFLFAVFYAAVFQKLNYSIAFAGLGAASFIGFFFLGPIQKTQAALSNLIQAEIAFMNYFEQISFLENYAGLPRDNAPGLLDPEHIEKASALLQQRSQETIDLLQKYLEDAPKRSDGSGRKSRTAANAG